MLTTRSQRPGGYATWTGDGATIERDTLTCSHCNNVFFVEPGQSAADAGGWCLQCMKPICSGCAEKRECVPFERLLEQQEARDRLRRQIAGLCR